MQQLPQVAAMADSQKKKKNQNKKGRGNSQSQVKESVSIWKGNDFYHQAEQFNTVSTGASFPAHYRQSRDVFVHLTL